MQKNKHALFSSAMVYIEGYWSPLVNIIFKVKEMILVLFIYSTKSTKVICGKVFLTKALHSSDSLDMSTSNGGCMLLKVVKSVPKFEIQSMFMWKYFFSSRAENLPVFGFWNRCVKCAKKNYGFSLLNFCLIFLAP